jgi:hypothetical protein
MPEQITLQDAKDCLKCLGMGLIGNDRGTTRVPCGEHPKSCRHQKLCNALKVDVDACLRKEEQIHAGRV